MKKTRPQAKVQANDHIDLTADAKAYFQRTGKPLRMALKTVKSGNKVSYDKVIMAHDVRLDENGKPIGRRRR